VSEYKIRAVTVALPEISEDLIDLLKRLKEECRGADIWTFRLALPPSKFSEELVEKAEHFRREADFDYLAIPFSLEDKILDIAEAVSEFSGVFASINISSLDYWDIPKVAEKYFSLLDYLRRRGNYITQCKIALAVRGPVLTPYFPCASSIDKKPCLMGALLYINYLKKGVKSAERIRRAGLSLLELLSRAGSVLGFDVAGVDLSISPWMEESVVELVADKNGLSLYKILKLNKAIEEAAEELRVCGFNEVMLPLAEDNGLKELVRKGVLRGRDFVAASAVCVAGVDLVLLSSVDPIAVLNYIKDCLAVAHLKGRPFGLRLVYTDGAPGDEVELGKFGKTPVVEL